MAVRSDKLVREFLTQIDILADWLRPTRRSQDAGAAECSAGELRVLVALSRNAPLTMSELAATLAIPFSTLTRMIDRLVAKGLLKRGKIQADGRVVKVDFSARGRKINRYVVQSRTAVARQILKTLLPAEREGLVKSLARMAIECENDANPPPVLRSRG